MVHPHGLGVKTQKSGIFSSLANLRKKKQVRPEKGRIVTRPKTPLTCHQ